MGSVASGLASCPSDGSSSFLPLGSARGGSAGILLYHSMPALLHLGNTTTSGGLGVECLEPSCMFKVSYIFPSHALVSLVLSKFMAEHVKRSTQDF